MKKQKIIPEEAANLRQKAEEKYTEMYNFAPSGYLTLTKDGKIKKLNFAAAHLPGKKRSKLILKHPNHD